MQLPDHIKDLPNGQSLRCDCPSCGGRNTFTARNIDGVIVYNCYKLGCIIKGATRVGMTAEDMQNYLRQRKETQVSTPTQPVMELPAGFVYELTAPPIKDFIERWQLENVPLIYDSIEQRAVFPLRDANGRMIDAVGRGLRKETQPKWKRYTGAADYYSIGSGDTAVVVEDCISAVTVYKCCKNVTAYALLGTNLSARQKVALTKHSKIVIALDPDAYAKTMEYARELDAHAMLIHDDFKYRHYDDIKRIKELTA
jgi:hypothetical protein